MLRARERKDYALILAKVKINCQFFGGFGNNFVLLQKNKNLML